MPCKDLEARKAYAKAYAAKHLLELNVYRKEWKAANKDKVVGYNKKYKDKKGESLVVAQRERIAKWREHNIEKVRKSNRERAAQKRADHPEKIKAAKKQYAQRKKDVVNAAVARRKAMKLQRTPQWLTEDDHWLIEQAYDIAATRTKLFGFAWHVDHIIPLLGKNVSGLHVPKNLQVIPGVENLRKGNRHG